MIHSETELRALCQKPPKAADSPVTPGIRTIRPEWTQVLDRMILVTLHVGRWRAKTRAEFQEFGLDGAVFDAYTAGTRHLLPRELQQELDTLERLAWELQYRCSFQTLFGHLMPKERYEEFKARINDRPAADLVRTLRGKTKRTIPDAWATASLRQRWFALGEQIADQRDQIVDQVVEAYRPAAIVRWRVANGLPQDGEAKPPDEWLDETLAEMVRRIPTAREIRDSFALDIIPAFVEAPDEAVKAAKLEDIERQQAEVERRLAQLDQAKIRAAEADARAAERVASHKAAEEMQREREKTRLALLADRERLDRERRITQEILEVERQAKQERIEQTLDEVAGQLHTLVYDAVCDGLEQVQKSGKLHPRFVGRVKSLVEQVRLLNFTDDAELERVCGELERMARDNAASEKRADDVRDVLRRVGISLKADLVAAHMSTRSARTLGIPDDPVPDLVREARREQREVTLFSALDDEQPTTLAREARQLAASAA